jgi:hypothetical protein
MTRLAQAALDTSTISAIHPRFMDRLRSHFARMEAALAGQSRLAALPPEALCDTALAAEDLTGAPTYDPVLPFFLQSNFGRSDR